MKKIAFLLVLAFGVPVLAQNPGAAPEHFRYKADPKLVVKQGTTYQQDGVTIHEITYASPKGGDVPAYLVLPIASTLTSSRANGKLAGIVWSHWMMPNAPTANRSEFLEEAIALARTGVVSLLIDAPMVRPGFKAEADLLGPQRSEATAQHVIDLRRGIDLLLARQEVDPGRIAVVGHSFGANCGAILDAVDKRIAAIVFMGNPVSMREFLLESDAPAIVGFRKMVPPERLKQYVETNSWADPGAYAGSLGPAPALFQYATHDEFLTVEAAKHFFAMSSGPKQMKFYDADHALNAEARRDRIEFLRQQLKLGPMPAETLEKVSAITATSPAPVLVRQKK